MTLLRAAFVAVLLLATPAAFAQLFHDVRVYPPGPTDETPITVTSVTTCFPDARSALERSGNTITIVYTVVGPCPTPPFPFIVTTKVGTLPAGSYRLRHHIVGSGETFDAGTIHVRHAASPAPFDIHPFAVPTNPAGLQLRASLNGEPDLILCFLEDCSDVTIRVGGVEARNLRRDDNGRAVFFDAPPHPPGMVDVVVDKRGADGTWTYTNALLYYDGPDLSAFERILFPVLFDAPGSNGSEWVSEATVANPNPFFVENFNSIQPFVCITYPCGHRLSPNSSSRIIRGRWPNGVALLVPRVEADALAFGLRIRDVSRQAEGFGTEIPVVREKNLVLDRPIRLLDAPLDPRYRLKLRVYAFDPQIYDPVRVTVVDADTGAVTSTQFLPLSRCESCATTPVYAEVDLQPGAEAARVSVYVDPPPGAPSWAFLTVTNNDTQQVTVVTPQ